MKDDLSAKECPMHDPREGIEVQVRSRSLNSKCMLASQAECLYIVHKTIFCRTHRRFNYFWPNMHKYHCDMIKESSIGDGSHHNKYNWCMYTFTHEICELNICQDGIKS